MFTQSFIFVTIESLINLVSFEQLNIQKGFVVRTSVLKIDFIIRAVQH